MAWLWVDQSRRRTKDTKDSKEGPRCLRALFFFSLGDNRFFPCFSRFSRFSSRFPSPASMFVFPAVPSATLSHTVRLFRIFMRDLC